MTAVLIFATFPAVTLVLLGLSRAEDHLADPAEQPSTPYLS